MATTVAGQESGGRAARPPRVALLLAAALVAAGCGPPVGGKGYDFRREAAHVTGDAALIRFHTQGGPIDAPADAGPRLTRADAVRLALASDPDLQVALAKVRSAEADARQARLLPNPVLSVVVRFREGGGDPIITPSLTTDLLSILQQPTRTRAADRRLRASAADALTAVLDRVSGVEGAYDAVQSLDAQVAVLADRRALLDRLLTIARARLDAGEGTGLDVTTARGERLALEEQVAERDLQRRVKRLALARLIGRPSDPADWQLDPWQPPVTVGAAESAWVSAALANRPEVQARLWELAAAGDDAALAASDIFKGLDAGAEFERDVTWSGGPSLSTPVPLFDWGQASKAKARAAQVQARHELTKTRRVVVEETRSALATLATSQAALARVRDELVPLQEQRRQQAEALYRAGETDITSLLVAEQSTQEAREREVLLRETAAAAMAKLHRAVGGPNVAAGLTGAAGEMQPVSRPAAPATRSAP
jgi:cobalt-zinc-cadmium efflux system outer membrane protein